jgi:hypothetical protein
MFAVLGDAATFCDWVRRLGVEAMPAAPTARGGWAGAGFGVAFVEGATPVEAAGRAVLVAAR